jgi:hypothetical protein
MKGGRRKRRMSLLLPSLGRSEMRVCWCGHRQFAHSPDGAQACEIRRCPCRRFDTRRYISAALALTEAEMEEKR